MRFVNEGAGDDRSRQERPETITIGTNELIGTKSEQAASRAGTIDGGAVEKRRDCSEMGRQGTSVQTTEATSDFILK